MIHRRLTITFHGSLLILTVFLLGIVGTPLMTWSFTLATFGLIGLVGIHGLQSQPGPALNGWLRRALPLIPFVFNTFLLLAGALTVANQILGKTFDLLPLYLFLIWGALFHDIFNPWRHMALSDGCLRTMTPRFLLKTL